MVKTNNNLWTAEINKTEKVGYVQKGTSRKAVGIGKALYQDILYYRSDMEVGEAHI